MCGSLTTETSVENLVKSWRYSQVLEHLLTKHKALPNPALRGGRKEGRRKEGRKE
jgi:hypothetical protein